MPIDYSVTLRTLSLGSADTVTGWYGKSFANSTIDMVILPVGASVIGVGFPIGFYTKYTYKGVTRDALNEGDEIQDSVSNYYEVEEVAPFYRGHTFEYNMVGLTKLPLHAERPTTSGSWTYDPRERTKVWLDNYLTADNIKEDDGTTNASFITCFDGCDYPLTRIFNDKSVDVVFAIGYPESIAQRSGDQTIRYYHEKVPITIHAVDKVGITGTKVIWNGEREIRRIAETYPSGSSQRNLSQMGDKKFNLGSTVIYGRHYILEYTRNTAVT